MKKKRDREVSSKAAVIVLAKHQIEDVNYLSHIAPANTSCLGNLQHIL